MGAFPSCFYFFFNPSLSNLRISENPACGKIRFFWKNIYPWVKGVAYTNIITEATNSLVYILFMLSALRNDWSPSWNFDWIRELFRVGFFSGLDSLVRNLVYMLVILRSMNLLSESGLYWTTNTFIWSYILLPFTPLSEVLRLDISRGTI